MALEIVTNHVTAPCTYCDRDVEAWQGVRLVINNKPLTFHKNCIRRVADKATGEPEDLTQLAPGLWGRSGSPRPPSTRSSVTTSDPNTTPPKYKPIIPPRRKS